MFRPARSGTQVAAVLLVATLLVSACSGTSKEPDAPAPTDSSVGSSAPDAAPLATTSTVEKVAGRLPKPARRKVRTAATRVVDAWFDAAYVGGDYPRNDFHDAYPGFTAGATKLAHHDRALMSNQRIGKRVDTVTAVRRRVRLDVLAAHRRAVAVTARFSLVFRTTGRLERRTEVRGRLYLTREHGRWRVFGYDVTKGDAR